MPVTSSAQKSSNSNSNPEPDQKFTPDEDQKEKEHFQKVVDALRYYRWAVYSIKGHFLWWCGLHGLVGCETWTEWMVGYIFISFPDMQAALFHYSTID